MKLETLTVKEILTAPVEYDHELSVRSIGPALVLVLEKEAPFRLEVLASTEAEHDALREEIRSNEVWGELLDVYFETADERRFREDEHAVRLDNGRRISNLRVTD